MKAAVLHEVNKPLVIEDVSVPNPGPREVLIRTRVAGLCHSDLHFMEGLYPHPLPATRVRIRTSRGPGFGTLTSSITSGLLTSCRTAAFIEYSLLIFCIF